MKISALLADGKPHLSFEVFPPKSEDRFDSTLAAALSIAELGPDYMSVTYGAGGSNAGYALETARALLSRGVTPLAHLTCITDSRDAVTGTLASLGESGVQNILALRGDLPAGVSSEGLAYRHASDLVAEIRAAGDFCVGGACYPEVHPESADSRADLEGLRAKVEAGCEFLVTQMFFDNHILYNFLWRMEHSGIHVPVVAGIMPVTSAAQIRHITEISGRQLPQPFVRLVDRYGNAPAAMKQAGILFASQQIADLLANGVNAVHVYSMNKPDVARAIFDNVRDLLR